MDQLTSLDAGFLEAEDSDPNVSLAIGGIAVIEGPMPDDDELLSILTQRLLSIPRFRQMLRTYPLDFGAPRWIDSVALDISHHVRRAALTRPNDDSALFRLTADLMERRLDRNRPLWECWIIEGLADGRWAILMKVHHCMADGIAATHMLSALADGGGESDDHGVTYATRIRAVSESATATGSFRLTWNPMGWLSSMWSASSEVATAAARLVQGALDIGGGLLGPAPQSSLTGSITGMRRYSSVRVPLTDVTQVCETFGVTLNDVALAALTDSYRAILLRRGEQPQRHSLRTLVPVSVRSRDAADRPDNRVSIMLPELPIEIADPVEQLREVNRRLGRTKGSGQRQAGSVVTSAANIIPFALTAWIVRALTRLPQHSVAVLATNVPGPRRHLQIMGRNVIGLLPVPPIALSLRTGVAILSYADHLTFGITADFDAAPDIDQIADGIGDAVARLVTISRTHWRSTPKGTLSLLPALPLASG
jgi:diacylglycerol O-acyltransferase